MALLEEIYHQLRSADLLTSAEAFSKDYLGKNSNWYSYQRHTGRDFSIGAAVQCLRSLRIQQRREGLTPVQMDTLQHAATKLLAYLIEHHSVSDVC